MNDLTIITEYSVAAYLAIGIAKSMLILVDVPLAAGTAHRISGKPVWLLMIGFFIGLSIATLLLWPRALATEGWRFFLVCSRFGVIRQIVKAYGEIDSNHSERLT